jgi:hypothetical protein
MPFRNIFKEPETRRLALPAVDVKLRAERKLGGRAEALPHNGCAARVGEYVTGRTGAGPAL